MLGMLGVSGCTGDQNYSGTAGVQINDMSFDYPSMTDDPNEVVSLAFELENVGSKDMAGDGTYWIYGPAINDDPDNVVTPDIWRTKGNLNGILTKGDFYPPIEGVSGAVVYDSVDFNPPAIPAGMSDSYNFFTRVCYPYTTTSLFKLYSQSREERASSRKMVGSKQVSTDSAKRASAGPIQIDLNTQKEVIIKSSGGGLNLYFTVTDVGGGFATNATDTLNCPIKATGANVPSTERGIVNVSVMVDGKDCLINEEKHGLARIRGGTGNFNCRVAEEDMSSAALDPNHEFTVVARADYKYWIDSQASIIVEDSY
ncbi:MAG: hypothetical protein KAJ47_03335 [Candidatus Aenigmarchaeota archaeon]|nr:hypothetical protein [Candidatus Aenigmarchaeota archaeon]